ncbi:MAG: histone deacetylase [Oscillatoriales cyanobacterium RM2_1_1]|nr:histone deacetylase [Oscillatoriales cyanobacterium SM2_3_0]NJO46678.1 histone deacetylase [Oscillatoriales cyanobacterium RM2_1_1]
MDLPVVYHRDYVTPLPLGHRFPMQKFGLLCEHLIQTGVVGRSQIHTPELPPRAWIELVHCPDYVRHYCEGTLDAKAQRRIGLPWSPGLAHRTQIAVGGAILTAQLALTQGLACNTAGGTHHAFPDFGSGFCIFNDLAIAARVIQHLGLAKKILILDLDVHQGDATAFIFQDDPRVFTFSMHCEANFPARKQQSDLDIPLPIGMEDELYLQTLAQYLPDLLSAFQPDLVLYDAGVDPHGGDRLGKLALTDAGLWRREMQVLTTCISQGYPVAGIIGGGYCDDLEALVRRHALLHRAAAEVYRQYRL